MSAGGAHVEMESGLEEVVLVTTLLHRRKLGRNVGDLQNMAGSSSIPSI